MRHLFIALTIILSTGKGVLSYLPEEFKNVVMNSPPVPRNAESGCIDLYPLECPFYLPYCSDPDYEAAMGYYCQLTCGKCGGGSGGEWGDWSVWGDCTAQCGGGETIRTRTCITEPCDGSNSETMQCNTEACGGVWGEWGDWSACSDTCGGGVTTRLRSCLVDPCVDGDYYEQMECNIELCPDPCASHICHEHATCENDGNGGYTCSCKDGYIGDGYTCNTGVCEDSYGRAYCRERIHNCYRTRIAERCQLTCGICTIPDVDECALGTHNCDQYAVCTNTDGSFECTCPSGFRGDGTICRDRDECYLGTDDCNRRAICENTPGSYTCTCKTGLEGDGVTSCKDIDECSDGSHECDAVATCTNVWKSYECACPRGYNGDGFTCTDKDECASGNNICSVYSVCKNTEGSYSCFCKSGYQGDGFTCTDLNECTNGEGKCHDKATCTNTAGGYTCTCNAGYDGNGFECLEIIDETECSRTCGKGVSYKIVRDPDTGEYYRKYYTCGEDKCPMRDCRETSGYTYRRSEDLDNDCCMSVQQSCGVPQFEDNPRVLGGVDANEFEFPWQVFVYAQLTRSAKIICGGAILNQYWILTAGHCVQQSGQAPYEAHLFKIIYSKIYVNQTFLDDTNTPYNVDKIIPHPNLDFPKDDIALMKLSKPINFANEKGHAMPICLPSGEDPLPDSTCIVTGYGMTTNMDSTHSEILQKAPLEIFTNDVCMNAYRKEVGFGDFLDKYPEKWTCAGALESSQDSCRGDSGSPLVCQRKGTCDFYVTGIVSFGPSPCAQEGKPGVYVRVQNYETWITETMDKN